MVNGKKSVDIFTTTKIFYTPKNGIFFNSLYNFEFSIIGYLT